jgi:hypothetical protein
MKHNLQVNDFLLEREDAPVHMGSWERLQSNLKTSALFFISVRELCQKGSKTSYWQSKHQVQANL